MALTITKQDNGYFLFESNNQQNGDSSPWASQRNDEISFYDSRDQYIESSVPYGSITVVEGGNTHDSFASAEEVMDLLVSIGFGVPSSSGAEPYKVFVATLSQTGTNDPVVTIIRNTLGYEPTIGYPASVGSTGIVLTDLDETKTQVIISPKSASAKRLIPFYSISGDVITLRTYNLANSAYENDMLLDTPIEIRVYE